MPNSLQRLMRCGFPAAASYDPNFVNPFTFCAVCHKGWPGELELEPAARRAKRSWRAVVVARAVPIAEC